MTLLFFVFLYPLSSATPLPEDVMTSPSYHSSISTVPLEMQQKMTGVSWHEGCPLSMSELSLISLRHWTEHGTVAEGELVVSTKEAENIAAIFGDLFAAGFQMSSIKAIHHFKGSDDASMKANNTSAFNCRNIKNTDRYSQHSYGEAIDINPLWNPWVRGDIIDPPEGRAFLDRSMEMNGLIKDDDIVVTSFAKRGWKWGGHWNSRKDYQHFSTSGK